MKKTLVLLACVAAVSAFSQGTVNFVTRDTSVTPNVNALISYTNSTVAGPVANGAKPSAVVDASGWGGINAKAGLYGGANGTAEGALVLLVPAVGFRTGAAAGYVNPGSVTWRAVPGVAPGAAATFQVRAWDMGVAGFDSYEAAAAAGIPGYIGKSPLLNDIILANPNSSPPGTPAPLIGLQGFAMDYVVPEPSIIGLGLLGAVAGLLVFRRRN